MPPGAWVGSSTASSDLPSRRLVYLLFPCARTMAHILIIEDDERVRRLFSTLLQHAGHQASEARDGREGLALQAECHPDLVITDIVMPGMEGLETISALRRLHPDLPIIAISG